MGDLRPKTNDAGDTLAAVEPAETEESATAKSRDLDLKTPAADAPKRSIRRVLLAESDSVCRNVALHILETHGYQIDYVSSGSDALQSAGRGIYDLILLDTDLPEIDGLAVTRAIRRLPERAGRKIPIIALTSGSTPADREERRGAGMSDYIVKPLRPKAVASVLARWDASAQAVAPPMAIDRDLLAAVAEVAGDGSQVLLQELIELFQGSVPRRLTEMRQALKGRDLKTVRNAAHSLSGSAGQLGATAMAQTCASIETLAGAGSSKKVRELMDQLDVDFERACRDLQELARQGVGRRSIPEGATGQTTLDLAALGEALGGSRVLGVYADRETVSQLERAFEGTDCRIDQIATPQADCSSDILFWAGDLDSLSALRKKGLRTPVIFLAKDPDAALLDRLKELDADFVVQPIRASDLQLRAYASLSAAKETRRAQAEQHGSNDVLVAEDDALIARFLVTQLQGAGFQITLVGDGEAALEALDRKQFGVVVLDINMPKLDGFGVLSRLRLRPDLCKIPVLMLSSRAEEHDIVKAFELGAEDYVTKPFNPLEVVSRVRRLARRS